MSVTTFAAISIGSYEIELKIFEISPKTGIRVIDPKPVPRKKARAFII